MDINVTRLRCMLGWLGMLLPWIVVLLVGYFPNSISATYYNSKAITPFMIILGSAGLLLISYKGYEKVDDIVTTVAGILGLCICIFPCGNTIGIDKIGTFNLSQKVSDILHLISAIGFFGILAFNSFFLFTKTSGVVEGNKKKRNIIFRVCAVGMLASFLLLLLPDFRIKTWLVEAIALAFFGVSWLTKANYYKWLFKDKE